MLGGFGGPNVGLNGMNNMNMNMGFNGQGQFGGPWMAGQDNYNGNGNGNFGGQGGYNISSHQGNFNQMNNQHYPHHNDFQHGYGRHGFHNRGNRGRRGVYHGGGYMRNNYGHMHQGNQNGYANQGGFANQGHHLDRQSETDQGYAANLDEPVVSEISNEAAEAQMLKELNPGGDDDDQDHEAEPDTSKEIEVTEGQVTQEPHPGEQSKPSESQNPNEESQVIEVAAAEHMTEKEPETDVIESAPMPIQTFISDEPRSNRNMPPPGPNVPLGPAAQFQGRGLNRGFPANGHTVQSSSSVDPKGLGVAGAPTGPRALREGLPNTGASGRKGFAMHGRATTSAPSITSNTKERERGSDMRHEKEHGREHEAEREKTQAQNDRDETRR